MFRRLRYLSETFDVVRPVTLGVAAIAVIAYAMAVTGRQMVTLLLGAVLLLIAGVMILQIQRAVRRLRRQSETVRKAAVEAERHYVDVLRRILKFVETREQYAHGHCERVGALAAQIGARLHLGRNRCRTLGLAGELLDIGLLAVPDGVLAKRGRFGTGDMPSVQKHSQASYDILKPLGSLADALPGIRHHHERMNGTGYPDALVGEDIPIEARILAVADTFDAMTHDRPQSPAMAPLAAVGELRRCSPAGYDSRCVEALAHIFHVPKLEKALSLTR